MYILRPSDERLRKKTNGTLIKMCIRLYQSILKWLLKSYRHYAISDVISIDCEKIKITHEFRDLEFEKELLRNNIDTQCHILYRDMPVLIPKGRHGFCFNYFKWKDLKSIYIDDEEMFIKHDEDLSINGNVSANIKSSTAEDMIIRIVIGVETKKGMQLQDASGREVMESLHKNRKAKLSPKNGLFKEERALKRGIQNDADDLSDSEGESRIAKRGFEIDTTF